MRQYFKYFVLYSLFPLVVGLIIYLSFGPTSTRVYAFFEKIIGQSILSQLRPDFDLPLLIRFHVADGIWAFALTSTLFLVLHKEMNAKLLLLFSIISFTFYELCQYLSWIGGTSDLKDVGFMLLFSLLSYYLLDKKLLRCENSSYSY